MFWNVPLAWRVTLLRPVVWHPHTLRAEAGDAAVSGGWQVPVSGLLCDPALFLPAVDFGGRGIILLV